jgi:hypothetical protein
MRPGFSGVIRAKPATTFWWPWQAFSFNDAKAQGPINAKVNQWVPLDVAITITGWLGAMRLICAYANPKSAAGGVMPDPLGNRFNLPFGSAVAKPKPTVLVVKRN